MANKRSKKILSILTALCLMASMFTVLCVPTAFADTYGDFEYSVLDDDTVEITRYNGSATRPEIPAKIDGKPVTSIGEIAFEDCISLTSIIIPDSITNICGSAFFNTAWYNNQPDGVVYAGKVAYKYKGEMPENTTITLKDGTKGIAGGAFYYCDSLTSVTIPDSVTHIGHDAFSGCTSLTSIMIPDSTTSIGSSAFNGCKSLTDVTIPDSVTSISEFAFCNCESLTSITIPNSVTSIGYYAFCSCESLTSITIPDSVISIGSDAFYFTNWYDNQSDGVVYAGKVAYKYKGEMPENTTITLKDGTKGIADSAFKYCKSLTSITIPDSVTCIGYDAFEYCESLMSVTIPNSVTNIGDNAFYDCTSLTSITIPDGVTSIGSYAFNGCDDLTIYGYTNSYAERYANENDIPFVSIGVAELFGDINGDNTVDVMDIAISRAYIVGSRYLSGKEIQSADMNGDGLLDIIDVVMMRAKIVNG